MAIVVAVKDSYGFNLRLQSNQNLTGVTSFTAKINKPDINDLSSKVVIEKNLTDSDVVTPATGVIDLPIVADDLDVASIYDVMLTDLTGGSKELKYPPFQFKVIEGVEDVA